MSKVLERFLSSRDVGSIAAVLDSSAPTEEQLNDAIRTAVREGHAEAISKLVAAGASLRTPNPETLWPLLHLAVEHEQLDAISELVKLGANVDELDSAGWTPLHMAVDAVGDAARKFGAEPDLSAIRLLLRLGSNPSIVDKEGRTPCELAEEYQQPRIAEVLR